jgi:2-polyprenyl-6-hydroxyphenyl methylase/3-demethylubiquinone-9 3-methyltransferase
MPRESASSEVIRKCRDFGRRALRKLTGAPRPLTTRDVWDDEYQCGKWRYLRSDEELPRYALLAAYLRKRCFAGRLLDLGCGEGILCDHLWPGSYSRYVGVDISQEAVAQASRAARPNASFVCADVEHYVPGEGEQFDAILFNEVLYYFSDPAAVAARFSTWLAPQGTMLASIYAPSLRGIRNSVQRIDRQSTATQEYTLTNRPTGRKWIVKAWAFDPDHELQLV